MLTVRIYNRQMHVEVLAEHGRICGLKHTVLKLRVKQMAGTGSVRWERSYQRTVLCF